MMWIVLKENYLMKCLEKDNVESQSFLEENLKFVTSLSNIDKSKLNNVTGIIIEKNKELSFEDEEIILDLKNRGISVIGNFEWCEFFLHRIP